MLPGADCHGCGYPDCRSLGKAILGGDAEATQCIRNYEAFTLKVNGESLPLNNFVRRALINMLTGFIKALKGGEDGSDAPHDHRPGDGEALEPEFRRPKRRLPCQDEEHRGRSGQRQRHGEGAARQKAGATRTHGPHAATSPGGDPRRLARHSVGPQPHLGRGAGTPEPWWGPGVPRPADGLPWGPSKEALMKKKILVGTDTTAAADLAVAAAADLAGRSEAELLVVQVRSETAARDAADPKKTADPDRYLASMPGRFQRHRPAGSTVIQLNGWSRSPNAVASTRSCSGTGTHTRMRSATASEPQRRTCPLAFIVDTRTAQEASAQASVSAQEREDCLDPPVDVDLPGEPELVEQADASRPPVR
jgi:nucleotide-binding universal stress UspA family protein